MSRRIHLTALAAVVASMLPLSLAAQVAQPAAPGLQDWVRELQQVDARIQPLREQALQDAALRAEKDAVKAAIRTAIIADNPALEAQLEKLEKFRADARAAEAAGDAEKAAALTKEAEAIQPEIDQAHAKAMDNPEISAQYTAFQEKLNKRIIEIDPEAKALLDRRQELAQQIKKARAGGGS